MYTLMIGKARAINISSVLVKPCSCGGTGEGIIEFSLENLLGHFLSLEHRRETYLLGDLLVTFSGQVSLEVVH